jgi:hypothetical protein
MFNTIGDIANSWDTNKVWRQHWHKTANPQLSAASGGFWLDLSMAAGTPKYNAYVGDQLAFTPLVGGSNNGINCGTGGDSWIHRYNLSGGGTSTAAWPAGVVMLMDYVGFYPLVDMDNIDEQVFDNTLLSSRYSSGMRCMVVTTTPQTAAAPTQVLLEYEGSNGVTTVSSFFVNSTFTAGALNCFSSATGGNISGVTAPFVPLGPGTFDVKKLNSVTITGSSGGFCAFVLVKPILEAIIVDNATPYEIEAPRNMLPYYVPNGAYLNHIVCGNSGSAATGVTRGHITFVRK